jgi:folate-binding protein YgfZ
MVLLLDAAAVRRRTDRVLRVSGPDRHTYLHSLLSQDLEHAAPGTATDFLYLDAKGNAQAMGRAVVAAGAVLLVVPAEVAGTFADALGRFTFLLDATTENLGEQWAVASVRGPAGADIPGARSEPMTVAPAGDGFVLRDRSGGVDLVGPAGWVDERLGVFGLPEASDLQWEAWRITAGEPAWGTEVVAGRRAQELGLLPTHVHLRKGCYPGQESIAKIYNLGRPRRVLAVVEFAGPVALGDPVDVGGKNGEVTSAAPAGEVVLALVLVPVDRDGQVVGDGTVMAGSTHGRVRRLVGAAMAIPGA